MMTKEFLSRVDVDWEEWRNIPVLLDVHSQAYIYRRLGPNADVRDVHQQVLDMVADFWIFYHHSVLKHERPPIGRFLYNLLVHRREGAVKDLKDDRAYIQMRFILDDLSGQIVLVGALMYIHESMQDVHIYDSQIDTIDPRVKNLRPLMFN